MATLRTPRWPRGEAAWPMLNPRFLEEGREVVRMANLETAALLASMLCRGRDTGLFD